MPFSAGNKVAMSLDIRVPTGVLFLLLGIILALYGLVTGWTSPEMYRRSLDVNINLWWGVVLGVFGAAMLLWARRDLGKGEAGCRDAEPNRQPSQEPGPFEPGEQVPHP